jgi:RNA polymerase sigma-70 factor (ECF subfamily)
MAIINLRDFYPFYTHNEFVEVPDVIAAELIADRRYEKAYKQRLIYNKAFYSLDADDGIEASATACFGCGNILSPETALDVMETYCRLCRTLNSLPEIQGRRIEAHYLLGVSQRDIAQAEGVVKSSVSESIKKGLAAMRKYLKEN